MFSSFTMNVWGLRRLVIMGLCVLALWGGSVSQVSARPDSRRFISVNAFKDRLPASGAYLELYRNGHCIGWGYANSDGTYRFNNLDSGDYEVRAYLRQGRTIFRGRAIGTVSGTHLHVFRITLQR